MDPESMEVDESSRNIPTSAVSTLGTPQLQTQRFSDYGSIFQQLANSILGRQAIFVPQNFSFRANYLSTDTTSQKSLTKKSKTTGSYRIYFTSYYSPRRDSPCYAAQVTLLCCDVTLKASPTGEQEVMDSDSPELEWSSVIGEALPDYKEKMSLEERLLRERMRQSSSGVTSYQLDGESGRIVYRYGGDIFYLDDDGVSKEMSPSRARLISQKPPIQYAVCPHNQDLVAYVSDMDVWVTHLSTGHGARLTNSNMPDVHRGAGVPTYVIQEEFDRYEGFWWQPNHTIDGPFRILYEEYDEDNVDVVKVMVHISRGQNLEEYRYPKPGKKNSTSTLKLMEFKMNDRCEITERKTLDLCDHLFNLFPEYEYLVRAGWTPDGKYAWCQLLNRVQSRLGLFLIPVANFQERGSLNSVGSCTVISLHYEDQPELWVPVNDFLRFLTPSKTSSTSPVKQPLNDIQTCELLWVSEATGYRHISHMCRNWQLAHESASKPGLNLVETTCDTTDVLTSGEWEVTGSEIWVNESHKTVFFLGLKEHPLRANLYAVRYGSLSQSGGAPLRLTTSDAFHHEASLDAELEIGVVQASSHQVLQGTKLVAFEFNESCPDAWVTMTEVALIRRTVEHKDVISPSLRYMAPPKLLEYKIPPGQLVKSHDRTGLVDAASDETSLYGLLFTPTEPPPEGRGYPTVHHIYAGPLLQVVTGGYNKHLFYKAQIFCHFGYAVLMCDSRGSHNRGLKFAGHIKYRMGQMELQEQTEFLVRAAQDTGLIDLNRVAIHGSSYGGYMSLMAMAQYNHIYRMGLASAPVVDWKLYDTGYTERYMGLPDSNPLSYKYGNVLTYARHFPSEWGRLVISHGGQDENVHLYHTSLLLEELSNLGKPYILQFYPTSRHRISQPHHNEATLLAVMEQHLKPFVGSR